MLRPQSFASRFHPPVCVERQKEDEEEEGFFHRAERVRCVAWLGLTRGS